MKLTVSRLIAWLQEIENPDAFVEAHKAVITCGRQFIEIEDHCTCAYTPEDRCLRQGSKAWRKREADNPCTENNCWLCREPLKHSPEGLTHWCINENCYHNGREFIHNGVNVPIWKVRSWIVPMNDKEMSEIPDITDEMIISGIYR